MIKMIVSDLDGTILHKDFTYTRRTIQAIKMVIEKGILFLPATGRPFQDIQDIFHKEGIKCDAICVNGALACDGSGNILLKNVLSTKLLKQCIKILQSYQFSIQIFTDQGVYAYEDAKGVAQNIYQVVSRNMGKETAYLENDVINEKDFVTHTILKLETMHLDDTRLEACKEELKKVSGVDVTSSIHGNIEITHKDSTKGHMLEKLLTHYHVKKDEVLIFGDSFNDESMFLLFPNTVAVANAKDAIQQCASALCGACEEDGVAKYLEAMLCK